ncbi:MAG: OmpA family protein [Archangium sp.]|nr:OmpA family protein [Archangium sp.]
MVVVALPAWADLIDVSLTNTRVTAGRGAPAVVLAIRQPIVGFRLTLRRGDGHVVDVRGTGKPGTTRSVPLPATVGLFSWVGTLEVSTPGSEKGELPLSFDTHVGAQPKLTFEADRDLDLVNRRVTIRLSNPVETVRLSVLLDTGQLAFDDDLDFEGRGADTPLDLTWPDAPGQVMKISVKATDVFGAYTGIDLFPWHVDIPHEDVVFDSGQAAVRSDQQPKLDASRARIAEVLAKVGRFAEVRLYVAGHTDTVGSTASNRVLSLQRAQAIAKAFRAKGLRMPMFAEGFGEEALAVGTPDETPEAANRRAQYLLAIEPPPVHGASFTPTWRRVP